MTGTNSLVFAWDAAYNDIYGGNPYYLSLGGGSIGATGQEARVAVPAAVSYTASNLGGRVTTNTYSGSNSAVQHMRVAGANGAQSVTWTGSGNNVCLSDATHTDTIAAGQYYNCTLVAPSGSPDIYFGMTQVQLNAASPNLSYASIPTGNGTSYGGYLPPMGVFQNLNAASEAAAAFPINAAGTLSNLAVNAYSGAGAGSATIRISGTNGHQTLSFSATGVTSDATHTDSVVAGQTVDISYTNGGSFVIQWTCLNFAGTYSAHDLGSTNNASNAGFSGSSGTSYIAFGGNMGGPLTTATSAAQKVPYALTVSALRIKVGSNSGNSGTLTSYINGFAGNQSVSIGSSATGTFTDATHTDTVVAGQTVCAALTLANGNTFTFPVVAATFDDGSVVPSSGSYDDMQLTVFL